MVQSQVREVCLSSRC